MWTSIEMRWQQLTRRERGLITLAAVIVLMTLFYALVWQPVDRMHARAAARLEKAKADWLWLNTQLARYHPPASGQTAPAVQPRSASEWMRVLQRSLRQAGLQPRLDRIEPVGEGVRLRLKRAPADMALRWLQQLARRGHVPATLSIRKQAAGRVDVEAVFGGGRT